ncbi:MAG: tRNA dihydrouridine synthase DusB [Deltaproteobacteria bacterium]|nr:tRNA dihydrouridine synthase DusB [Deltaproteobacteria bacterium]
MTTHSKNSKHPRHIVKNHGLQTIKIGQAVLPNPLFLAPMAGITDYPFRCLARSCGAGLVVSEMIASQALIRNSARSVRMASTAKKEVPLAVQISGSDPVVMAEAARINESLGAAIIDINMGCPQRKIVKTGAGASLMRDEVLAGKVIEAIVEAVSVPATVKIRLGWDHKSINATRIAKIAQNSGASLVTVHGRTRSQMFSGKADWSAIREVKEAVSIPVIANGDIQSPKDASLCIEVSGADGIMIGRGALGRPWLFDQILHFLKTGEDKRPPDLEEQYAITIRHFEHIVDFYGLPVGLWLSRKHLAWHTKGLHGSTLFRKSLNSTKSFNEVRELLRRFYEALLTTPIIDNVEC